MASNSFPHTESFGTNTAEWKLMGTSPLALAESFIRANISNPVAAPNIAGAAGVNMPALQRLFRQAYAATPTQVLLHMRITLAREIILNGEAQSVRQVAAQLQFSNPTRFSTLYRRIHFHTPSHEIRQGKARMTRSSGTNQ